MASSTEKAVTDLIVTPLNIPPDYRYERKFTIANAHCSEVLHSIRHHPAFFRPVFQSRQINNIYLDTKHLKFYKNNQIGIANRKKIRIRWYGDLYGHVAQPKLEYKLKYGLVGDKWIFDLKSFDFQPGFTDQYLRDLINDSDLPEVILADLKNLYPSLLNHYQRTYFLSADKNFRLTLDEQMAYYRFDYPVSNFKAVRRDDRDYIVELKYKPERDEAAKRIATKFPFRMDKSSKYVNGILAGKNLQ